MLEHHVYLLHSNLAFGFGDSSVLGPPLPASPSVQLTSNNTEVRGVVMVDLSGFSTVHFQDVKTFKFHLLFFIFFPKEMFQI